MAKIPKNQTILSAKKSVFYAAPALPDEIVVNDATTDPQVLDSLLKTIGRKRITEWLLGETE